MERVKLTHGGVFLRMKIRKMMKGLSVAATGIVMLGATAMGAMAADLNKYPNMFVDDGVFNGYLVVGENAASVDNLAMTDIVAGMKYLKAAAAATTTIEGDAWLVGTSSKSFEMANNSATSSSTQGGETIRDIATFIGDEELDALADGTFQTNENDYTYQQFLFFNDQADQNRSRIIKYTEDDEDTTADFFYIQNAKEIAQYKLEFASAASTDVTDSSGTADTTGTYLDDFENTKITLMGKAYDVVMARRTSSGNDLNQNGMKLTLMAGSNSDTLLEGESKTYKVADKEYDVTLTYVDDTNAKFTVNGEATNKLQAGETYVLSDKSEIGVSEVLYQSYAGGIHSASFFVGAQKIELRDDDISVEDGAYNLKVGSEDIDGSTVIITGTDNNVTATITTIVINMSAEDDFYVAAGGKLSDVIAVDEEEEVLMAGSFDIEYAGLTTEESHDLRLKTSSSRRYKLELYDGDNNVVGVPVAYAEGTANLSMGEESASNARGNDKRLHVVEDSNVDITDNASIYKNDYFIVTSGSAATGSAKSYLLQYKGADRQTKTSPKIKFKNTGSGETLEYSVTSQTATGTVATIKLGGNSFLVENASAMGSDDFRVVVDLDGSGATDKTAVAFVDYFGSTWTITDDSNSTRTRGDGNASMQDSIFVTIDPDGGNTDAYDSRAPTTTTLNITSAAGPEVRAAFGGLTLLTPDGETEVSYGYSTLGEFYTFNEPASDPDEMTLAFPKEQRLPQVYITSGATSASVATDGVLTPVTVVDATKLDSEIADVKAQNLIVVGGPCVNSAASELMGNPDDCTEGFSAGKARIKLFENGDKVAMLVAGYSGADTRLAGQVVAHKWQDLSGDEVVIEGTTYSDATISAPTVVETVEETTTETTEAAAETTE